MLSHHKNAHYDQNSPENELLAFEREQQSALEALTALNGRLNGKKLKTHDLLLHHSKHSSAFQPFKREMHKQNGSELNSVKFSKLVIEFLDAESISNASESTIA